MKSNIPLMLAFSLLVWCGSAFFPHTVIAAPEATPDKPADVVWARTDFPPFFIVEGEYANRGISDNLIKQFIQNIDGYQHGTAVMTLNRMLDDAKKGTPVCHVALLKNPEREQFLEYSAPVMIFYANGIITSEEGVKRFGLGADRVEYVDLAQLLGKDLSISVHKDRSYSPVIDAAIAGQQGKENSIFQYKSGLQEQERLIKQVSANRLDGFIARPEEVYFRKTMSNLDTPLYLIGIQGQALVSTGYVACAKGDWNDALFEQVNRLIKLPEIRNGIYRDHVIWLPENLARHYRRYEGEAFYSLRE